MDLATIQGNKKQIHELYLGVANNSDFNSAELHEDYFLELKRASKYLIRYYKRWNPEKGKANCLCSNGFGD